MKKFVFTLERMLAYQEQNLEKEKGILATVSYTHLTLPTKA